MSKKTDSNLTLAQEIEKQANAAKIKLFFFKFMPLVILIAVINVFGIINPRFLRMDNLYINILDTIAVSLLIVIGITPVILMGCIDLSVEGVTGFTACILGVFIANTKTSFDFGFGAVLIALASAAFIGFIQGLIHVKLKLPTFIVTFAIGYICKGLGLLTYMGIPGTFTDDTFRQLYFGKLLNLPVSTWLAFGMLIIAFLIENYTKIGRRIFAIGNNEEITKMYGINTNQIKILVFIWSGFCCGLAGVVAAAKLGYSIMALSAGTLFPALTAVVVGGTLLTGGIGGVLRSFVGVLIVAIINAGMIYAGIDSSWQEAVQGFIVLIAVVIASSDSRYKIVK